VPGAIVQIAVATALGLGLALLLGWSMAAGIVFGLALSVASTVVLIRALQERRIIDTERGRIAVGWLVVEDLAMVLALVLLPALAAAMAAGALSARDIAVAIGITLGKVGLFGAAMLLVGRRAIPALLHYVAHTGSRELFRLAVYVVALGVAFGAAKLFGVSFALGAFFAGMVLSESRLSQRAAEEALPLRDAFAVLFFVSVGMLFDPGVLLRDPLGLLATVLIIVVGKSVAAYGIVRLFGHGHGTALTISASLAQIGEFSFILAGLGVALSLLPPEGRDLVLAGAILSILLNPLVFWIAERKLPAAPKSPVPAPPPAPAAEPGHEVLVGYGRVGSLVGKRLIAAGRRVVVIEDAEDAAEAARRDGARVITGNAADPDVLAEADLPAARRVFVAIPEPFEAGQVVEQARAARPDIEILARAGSEDAMEHLKGLGATLTVMGEREIAHRMLERALGRGAQRAAA
jgi:monovalent cation:H+ antiporter-2, CPA2 family